MKKYGLGQQLNKGRWLVAQGHQWIAGAEICPRCGDQKHNHGGIMEDGVYTELCGADEERDKEYPVIGRFK